MYLLDMFSGFLGGILEGFWDPIFKCLFIGFSMKTFCDFSVRISFALSVLTVCVDFFVSLKNCVIFSFSRGWVLTTAGFFLTFLGFFFLASKSSMSS